MKIDDYKTISSIFKSGRRRYVEVECDICGHKKTLAWDNFNKQSNKHSKLNCKDDYYKMNVGKSYGDYVCTRVAVRKLVTGKQYLWELECKTCHHKVLTSDIEKEKFCHGPGRCGTDFYESLIGCSFGDFEVIGVQGKVGSDTMLLCRCKKCGVELVRAYRLIKAHPPKHGRLCWSLTPDSPLKRAIGSRWGDMYQRCNNPSNENYKHYGGRVLASGDFNHIASGEINQF